MASAVWHAEQELTAGSLPELWRKFDQAVLRLGRNGVGPADENRRDIRGGGYVLTEDLFTAADARGHLRFRLSSQPEPHNCLFVLLDFVNVEGFARIRYELVWGLLPPGVMGLRKRARPDPEPYFGTAENMRNEACRRFLEDLTYDPADPAMAPLVARAKLADRTTYPRPQKPFLPAGEVKDAELRHRKYSVSHGSVEQLLGRDVLCYGFGDVRGNPCTGRDRMVRELPTLIRTDPFPIGYRGTAPRTELLAILCELKQVKGFFGSSNFKLPAEVAETFLQLVEGPADRVASHIEAFLLQRMAILATVDFVYRALPLAPEPVWHIQLSVWSTQFGEPLPSSVPLSTVVTNRVDPTAPEQWALTVLHGLLYGVHRKAMPYVEEATRALGLPQIFVHAPYDRDVLVSVPESGGTSGKRPKNTDRNPAPSKRSAVPREVEQLDPGKPGETKRQRAARHARQYPERKMTLEEEYQQSMDTGKRQAAAAKAAAAARERAAAQKEAAESAAAQKAAAESLGGASAAASAPAAAAGDAPAGPSAPERVPSASPVPDAFDKAGRRQGTPSGLVEEVDDSTGQQVRQQINDNTPTDGKINFDGLNPQHTRVELGVTDPLAEVAAEADAARAASAARGDVAETDPQTLPIRTKDVAEGLLSSQEKEVVEQRVDLDSQHGSKAKPLASNAAQSSTSSRSSRRSQKPEAGGFTVARATTPRPQTPSHSVSAFANVATRSALGRRPLIPEEERKRVDLRTDLRRAEEKIRGLRVQLRIYEERKMQIGNAPDANARNAQLATWMSDVYLKIDEQTQIRDAARHALEELSGPGAAAGREEAAAPDGGDGVQPMEDVQVSPEALAAEEQRKKAEHDAQVEQQRQRDEEARNNAAVAARARSPGAQPQDGDGGAVAGVGDQGVADGEPQIDVPDVVPMEQEEEKGAAAEVEAKGGRAAAEDEAGGGGAAAAAAAPGLDADGFAFAIPAVPQKSSALRNWSRTRLAFTPSYNKRMSSVFEAPEWKPGDEAPADDVNMGRIFRCKLTELPDLIELHTGGVRMDEAKRAAFVDAIRECLAKAAADDAWTRGDVHGHIRQGGLMLMALMYHLLGLAMWADIDDDEMVRGTMIGQLIPPTGVDKPSTANIEQGHDLVPALRVPYLLAQMNRGSFPMEKLDQALGVVYNTPIGVKLNARVVTWRGTYGTVERDTYGQQFTHYLPLSDQAARPIPERLSLQQFEPARRWTFNGDLRLPEFWQNLFGHVAVAPLLDATELAMCARMAKAFEYLFDLTQRRMDEGSSRLLFHRIIEAQCADWFCAVVRVVEFHFVLGVRLELFHRGLRSARPDDVADEAKRPALETEDPGNMNYGPWWTQFAQYLPCNIRGSSITPYNTIGYVHAHRELMTRRNGVRVAEADLPLLLAIVLPSIYETCQTPLPPDVMALARDVVEGRYDALTDGKVLTDGLFAWAAKVVHDTQEKKRGNAFVSRMDIATDAWLRTRGTNWVHMRQAKVVGATAFWDVGCASLMPANPDLISLKLTPVDNRETPTALPRVNDVQSNVFIKRDRYIPNPFVTDVRIRGGSRFGGPLAADDADLVAWLEEEAKGVAAPGAPAPDPAKEAERRAGAAKRQQKSREKKKAVRAGVAPVAGPDAPAKSPEELAQLAANAARMRKYRASVKAKKLAAAAAAAGGDAAAAAGAGPDAAAAAAPAPAADRADLP